MSFIVESTTGPENRGSGHGRHAGRENPHKPAGRKSNTVLGTVALIVLMLIGAAIIAYPSISNWRNGLQAAHAVETYSQDVSAADAAALEAMFSAARDYNRSLAEKENQFPMSEEELMQYKCLLDPSGTGLMAYVTIPSLNETLPIYHGTDESVLQTAVGHLEWTSLPVGGESSHAVISGHRGLPRAKLFSDLDRLQPGDIFTVTVLDQTLAYEVDQIFVVLPEETEPLVIIPGGDYCTLVTCTPYGINTHRLLVRGRRIENLLSHPERQETGSEVTALSPVLKVTAVAVPVLFVFLLAVLAGLLIKRHRLRAAALRREERGKHE